MGFLQRSRASLTFIASDIAPALAAAIANGDSRWPALATFAARGTVRAVQRDIEAMLRPWQIDLLEAAGLGACQRAHPSAALTRIGVTQQITTEAWAHLECVHFAAGLSDLAGVVLQGEAKLSDEEREQIAATLAELLRPDGYELHPNTSGAWLVRLPRSLDVRTVAPEIAFSGPLQRALPQGRDAPALRRLMTELQMLLHEHPVNVRRARAGLPAANAAWLWGVGTISEQPRQITRLPTAFGHDPYLKGLYLLHGQSIRAERFSADALRTDLGSQVLVLTDAADLDKLEAEYLAPLSSALRDGSIERLELHLDRWRININRSDLRRFWKRLMAPTEWGT